MTKDAQTVRNRAHDRSVLQHAMLNREFGIAYQPIFDLVDMTVFGREALLRPTTASFSSPRDMLRVALTEGRMGELGRQLRRLATRGARGTRLFVNVHPHELDPRVLSPDDPIFAHEGGALLEFSPRAASDELGVSLGFLESIRSRGVSLVFDDFGGPRSNLRDLFEIAPHVVKLDPELLHVATTSARGQRFLHGIVRLSLDVGAAVIAKGVESQAVLDLVRSAGVRFAQGNLLAPPSPIASFDLGGS